MFADLVTDDAEHVDCPQEGFAVGTIEASFVLDDDRIVGHEFAQLRAVQLRQTAGLLGEVLLDGVGALELQTPRRQVHVEQRVGRVAGGECFVVGRP